MQSIAKNGNGNGNGNGNNKDVVIIVNTREHAWENERISYEQVITLAFGSYDNVEDVSYTVTFKRGHDDKKEGSLVAGEDVHVKDGMVFDVTKTNRS